jgi:hypothetical protein
MPFPVIEKPDQIKPPAELLILDAQEASMLQSGQDLTQRLIEEQGEAQKVLCGWQYLPKELRSLTYEPEAFRQLRLMKPGWDGYKAKQLPDTLVDPVRALWDALSANIPSAFMPTVLPGEDEFIVLSWSLPSKRLELNFYPLDADSVACDWVMETRGQKELGESRFDVGGLVKKVKEFIGT